MLVLTLVAVVAIIISTLLAVCRLNKHSDQITELQERLNETATKKCLARDLETVNNRTGRVESGHTINTARIDDLATRIDDLASGLQLLKSKFENFLESDKNRQELAKRLKMQVNDIDDAVEALKKQFAGFEEYRSKQSEFNLTHFDKVAALEKKVFEVKDFLTKPSPQICELEKKIDDACNLYVASRDRMEEIIESFNKQYEHLHSYVASKFGDDENVNPDFLIPIATKPKRVRTKKLGDGKKKIKADVSTDNYV